MLQAKHIRLMLLSTIVLLGLSGSAAYALDIPKIGVKGGLSISGIKGDLGIFDPGSKNGFSGGVSAEVALPAGFSLQSEILYVMKGFSYGKSEGTNPSGQPTGTFETFTVADYIEIPVLLQYRVSTGSMFTPVAVAGPAFAFKVREALETSGAAETSESTSELESFDFGLAIGAGLEVAQGRHHWLIEGRYTHGLSDLGFGTTNAKNRAIQVMAGFVFGL